MKSSDILFCLGEGIITWKVKDHICVKYDEAWVSDGVVLKGSYGVGLNFEEACDDYLSKIRGKTLIFDGIKNKRREVKVLG